MWLCNSSNRGYNAWPWQAAGKAGVLSAYTPACQHCASDKGTMHMSAVAVEDERPHREELGITTLSACECKLMAQYALQQPQQQAITAYYGLMCLWVMLPSLTSASNAACYVTSDSACTSSSLTTHFVPAVINVDQPNVNNALCKTCFDSSQPFQPPACCPKGQVRTLFGVCQAAMCRV